MATESCCTCARLLSDILPQYNEKTEKPVTHDRQLDCCDRSICGNCIAENSRFATYCPFCQVSSEPSLLPPGLRDPPTYSPPQSPKQTPDPPNYDEELPAYDAVNSKHSTREKGNSSSNKPAEDVLHFLDPSQDSILSLSLRYGVPSSALRQKNNLFSDNLLAARKAILIPGEYYKGGVSLSPQPIDSEEEEIRKAKIRRWMVACKVSDYDIALLYLKQADYNLDVAVEAYISDEKWEREHPIESSSKNNPKPMKKFGLNTGLTGQI